MDQAKADFEVRGLELHSLYAWDYPWVVKALDFIEKHGMNTLVLHRNDFVDLIVYPGAYFGYKEQEGDSSIFDIYSQIFRKLYQYTPTRRSCPYQRRSFLKEYWKRRAEGESRSILRTRNCISLILSWNFTRTWSMTVMCVPRTPSGRSS